jgi:DNA-binding NarL/FixJ family response regulator
MRPGEKNKSADDQIRREEIKIREVNLSYQQQTVLNLYNCGITPEIIALQLDLTNEEVISIIKKVLNDNKRKEESIKQISDSTHRSSRFYKIIHDSAY